MKSDIAVTGRVKCGPIYSANIRMSASGMSCAWEPSVPTWETFSNKDMAAYRSGRDALIRQYSELNGGIGIAVLE